MSFNRFDEFRARVAGDPGWNPATSNLFGVTLSLPTSSTFKSIKDKIGTNDSDISEHVNLLATEVSLPSRQLTTSEGRSFGAMYRYVTGTSFSEITISFLMTKDLWIRVFFERWMNYITDDTSNFVMTPDQYQGVLRISKWENGSNVVLRKKDNEGKVLGETRLKTCTGNWIIQGCFPFNISTMTLNNEETNLLRCDVSFYYERYRMDNTGGAGKNGLGGATKYIDDANALSALIGQYQLEGKQNSALKSIAFE
jgi:hypothetical protein